MVILTVYFKLLTVFLYPILCQYYPNRLIKGNFPQLCVVVVTLVSSNRSRPTCIIVRVRTGYGILEKLWNFEKEIPYMEKLWNLSKTAVPMEKLWNFRFGGKKCVLSLRPDFEM